MEGGKIFEKEREVDEVGVGGVERQHGAERRCGRVWTVERRPDAIDAIDALDAVDANSNEIFYKFSIGAVRPFPPGRHRDASSREEAPLP